MTTSVISQLVRQAISRREDFLQGTHDAAFRLFNGFTEGWPELVMDLYGRTLLFNNYAEPPAAAEGRLREVLELLRDHLEWIHAGVVKDRRSESAEGRRGRILFGSSLDDRICEDGIWYAIDLLLGLDASFYLDTRNLRGWARRNLRGKTVLNAFAHTGSLGVAAVAGGARRVVQLDRGRRFLELAKRSYALNGLVAEARDFVQADFFRQAGSLRRHDERFDCVIIDPPFFAAGSAGTVDQVHESRRLLNKARPLVEDGGYLLAINNALFVSGAEYMGMLQELCSEGFLRLVELVSVPDDCVGYGSDRNPVLVPDPAPFNHPTKIAILEVRRKCAPI